MSVNCRHECCVNKFECDLNWLMSFENERAYQAADEAVHKDSSPSQKKYAFSVAVEAGIVFG